MNSVDTLSTPFYEFFCDPYLIDEVLPQVEKFTFSNGKDNDPSITKISQEFFYHAKLLEWFENCLEEVRKLYFIDSIRLNVTSCWVTNTSKLAKHRFHRHQQSIVSGILYLQDDSSGETVFLEKSPWGYYTENNFMNITDINQLPQLKTVIKQEKGKLILFPSHILHGTNTTKSQNHRYTIAFDSFFSGRIFQNSQWPYFEVKSTTIKEIANQKAQE